MLLLGATPCFFRSAPVVVLEEVTLAPGYERAFTSAELEGIFGYLRFEAQRAEGELLVALRSPPERAVAEQSTLPLGELGPLVVPPVHLRVLETPGGAPLRGRFRWVEYHRWLSAFWAQRGAEFAVQLALVLFGITGSLRWLARREERRSTVETGPR